MQENLDKTTVMVGRLPKPEKMRTLIDLFAQCLQEQRQGLNSNTEIRN
jgi:hypothetical protein